MVEPALFNRSLLAQKRRRAAPALAQSRFLLDLSADTLLERLQDIKRSFARGVLIGGRDAPDFPQRVQTLAPCAFVARTDLTPALLQSGDVCADEEFLPFGGGALDLVLSNLSLHSVNDLPGVLIQIRHALKADGLFLASMLGGETLFELRQSFMQAELALYGGVSPRIMPFADKPQMGALLHRAGFALPVVDSDIITVSYPDLTALMRDVRAMGEASIIAARRKRFSSRRFFKQAEDYYRAHFSDPDGRLRASFEIIYLIGWTPHDSQQKPLKPGSAHMRLAEALGVKEEKL